MVGLSVLLENQKSGNSSNKIFRNKTPQVVSKTTMLINNNSSTGSNSKGCCSDQLMNYPVPSFLEQCFLCKQKLLPGKDIYMYRGDKAFCSVECRCRQIFMDEEETLKRHKCSLAAVKPSTSASSSASASSSSSSSSVSRHHRKAARNRGGGFAY
ncbi:hypothetical protein PTKIN_Ptkin10aG0016100 [Pterospermum kingtungense]